MRGIEELIPNCPVEIPKFAEDFIRDQLNQLLTHDPMTHAHCVRVSRGCLELAKELQLDILDQAIVAYAGLLHDIGKIRISPDIINKPSRLTEDEYEIMKQHTVFGVELIEPMTSLRFFEKVSDAIMYHHERVDGKGYFGLATHEIPPQSKLILAVDTVDAMTQDRAYRKGLPMQTALDELIRCSGTQFEPYVVDAYLNVLGHKSSVSTSDKKAS